MIHTPVGAPKANAVCERFIGSVTRELLDHILILSENHARRLAKEYVLHFNYTRPHQGIDIKASMDSSLSHHLLHFCFHQVTALCVAFLF